MNPTPGRPYVRASDRNLRAFGDHLAGCEQCRAAVVAAWAVSADVNLSVHDLCPRGLLALGGRMLDEARVQ